MFDNNIRLFEGDHTIVGNHASKIKFFKDEAGLYNTYIDVYLNAVILGFLKDRRCSKDTKSTDRARIYADAFSKRRNTCVFLYRIIILLHYEDLEKEDRINRAFRFDSDPEKLYLVKENLEVFNSYALGGIEVMYEMFIEECSNSKDAYIKRSFEIIQSFNSEFNSEYEETIKEYLDTYE